MTYDKNTITFQPFLTDHRFIDITEQVFGRLTVLGYAGKERHSFWYCECECGTIIRANVAKLRNGHTKSCGCLKKDLAGLQAITHGESRGGIQSPEYAAYAEAKKRCTCRTYKNFANWGGRGIEFRFTSFEQFLTEIGRRPTNKHSLDRIDNDGHYEIGNVRWTTQQSRNTRANRLITINGETHCLAEWVEITGIKTIRLRLWRGWCDKCAVTLESGKSCPHKHIVE